LESPLETNDINENGIESKEEEMEEGWQRNFDEDMCNNFGF
jgi:hypothetical protein